MVEKALEFVELADFFFDGCIALEKHAEFLVHTNLAHSNRLFSCRRSACAPTQLCVQPLIKTHLFSPSRHEALPQACRAITTS